MKKTTIVLGVLGVLILYMTAKNLITPQLGMESGNFKPLRNTPNGVNSQSQEPATKVKPLTLSGNAETSKNMILRAFDEVGTYKIIEEQARYLHVIFITDGMHFRDDVEVYFNEADQIIEYRSQSRIGYSDLGVNRERYEKILSAYTDQLNE